MFAGQHRIHLDGTEILLVLGGLQSDFCKVYRELRHASLAPRPGLDDQFVLTGHIESAQMIEQVAALLLLDAAILACADQQKRTVLAIAHLGEQFVEIRLAITHANHGGTLAAFALQPTGVLVAEQPLVAFFLLALGAPLVLLACPHLRRQHSEWQSCGGEGHGVVHNQPGVRQNYG